MRHTTFGTTDEGRPVALFSITNRNGLVLELISLGASIGVGAVLLSGISIGRFAMVSGGAVVHRSVPEQGLVVGVPARLIGTVCLCGVLVKGDVGDARCPACRGSSLLDASGVG